MLWLVSLLLVVNSLIDSALTSRFPWIDLTFVIPVIAAAILLTSLETAVISLAAMILAMIAQFTLAASVNLWIPLVVGMTGFAAAIIAGRTRRSLSPIKIASRALDSSPLAYAEFQFPGYTVLNCNEALEHMLSCHPGKKLADSVFPQAARKLSELMDEAVANRNPVVIEELALPTQAGAHSFWHLSIIPISPSGKGMPQSVTMLALDITEAVERSRSRDAALRMSAGVMSSLNLSDTLRVVLTSLMDIAGTDSGALLLIENGRWQGKAGLGAYGDEAVQALDWSFDELPSGVEALKSLQALPIEDALSAPEFGRETEAFKLKSSLVVPLMTGTKAVGAVWLNQTDQPSGFSKEQIESATIIGFHAALAVENATIYETERSMRKSLEAIEAISKAGLVSLDLDKVLSELVNRTKEVLELDAAMILLRRRNEDYLEVKAATGIYAEKIIGEHVNLGEGLPGLVLERGTPQKIDDLADHEKTFCPTGHYQHGICPFSQQFGIKSVLAFPLNMNSKVKGVLLMGSRRIAAFPQESWGFIQIIADRASLAVQNSVLHHLTTLELKRVVLLKEIAAACAGLNNLESIAERALEAIYQQLNCTTAGIYYLDPERQELISLAARGRTAEIMEQLESIGLEQKCLLTRAAKDQRMLINEIEDAGDDPCLGALFRVGSEDAQALIPIIYKGETVGVMVLNFPGKKSFATAGLETLGGIANQLAVAINSLRPPRKRQDSGSRPKPIVR